jgi:hypothetical protein
MYAIENLIKTFADHGEKGEMSKSEMSDAYRKEYPDEELPEALLDPFNISFALHSMCMEIKRLKAHAMGITQDAWKVDMRDKQ